MVVFAPEKEALTPSDVQLIEEGKGAYAREDFLTFRRLIHPGMLDTWWQRDVAKHLMQFWEDLIEGRRPALVLQAPPQHGKTEQVTDFMAWAAGKNPNLRIIFGSYSEDLGVRVNMTLQRLFDSERYKVAFAKTRLNDTNVVTAAGRHLRNSNIMEFVGYDGSFRNTTIMGQINGMGLDLGVIDDPIKGRAEASSKAVRDKTWSWFTDDFFGRRTSTTSPLPSAMGSSTYITWYEGRPLPGNCHTTRSKPSCRPTRTRPIEPRSPPRFG